MKRSILAVCVIVLGQTLAATDVNDANYGSVVIRDGVFISGIGHAGIVFQPLFGSAPNGTDKIIIQADGSTVALSTYASFLGGNNNYFGHFRTYDSVFNTPTFRADVVKFANQAVGRNYWFFNLYKYAFDYSHANDTPYLGVVPTDFRCDGLAEWSVEQALAAAGQPLSASGGFYASNVWTHNPIEIASLGRNDTAYSLVIDSDSPSSGVVIGVSAVDSLGKASGSTVAGGGLRRLYTFSTMVTLTAPALAPNGYVFQTWWGCTAANGGLLDVAARTCTTWMDVSRHR